MNLRQLWKYILDRGIKVWKDHMYVKRIEQADRIPKMEALALLQKPKLLLHQLRYRVRNKVMGKAGTFYLLEDIKYPP